MEGYVLIRGNTYPVRRELRALGAIWDPGAYGWQVPEAKVDAARALIPPWPQREYSFGKDTSIAEELHDTFMLYKDEDRDDDPYQ